MKSKKELIKVIILFAVIIFSAAIFSQTALGARLHFPAGFFESVKEFLTSSDLKLSAADYREGTIILIKPIATGVGEGRYEAGDIVEIRDGEELYQKYGNGEFLGKEEKTALLPLYYPKKLSDEEKQKLMEPEYEIENPNDKAQMSNQIQNPNDENSKLVKRRQYGIDYTQILSDREILKVRSFKQLDRIPEIDLSVIAEKNGRVSVVELPNYLTRIETAQRTLKKLAQSAIPFAFAATESVKTIMQSGGDYTTLNAWEAAQQADLVTLDRIAIAQIDGTWTSADTTAVTIDGWTTDATHYIKIYTTAAARHDGKWNEGKYRLVSSIDTLIAIYEEYTKIDGLQIQITANGNYDSGIYLTGFTDLPNGGIEISNNIIVGVYSSTYTNGYGIYPAWYASGSRTIKIWNNIFYGFINGSYNSLGGIYSNNGWIYYIYNNTIYENYYGINIISGTTVIAKNNISYNNTDNYNGSFDASSNYNLSGPTQTDAPGANSRQGVTVSFVNTTAGSEDFHLALSDLGARGYGLSQYADANLPVTNDIDGNYRRPNGEVTDIGADEDIDSLDGDDVRISNIQESGTRYSTLSGWETDRDGVITSYYPEVAQIDGAWTSADTAAVTIDGWTTDADHYIKVYTTTAARHSGVWDEGKYRLETTTYPIIISEEYVRLDGLQIKMTVNTASTRDVINIGTGATSEIRISNCILTGSNASTGIIAGIRFVTGEILKVWNNIIYGFLSPNYSRGIHIQTAGDTMYAYNNTVYGCYDGFVHNAGTFIAINNISYNNTDNYYGTFDASSTNNLSGPTQTDAPGSNPRNAATVSFVNTTSGSEDFHLASNDAGALGYGVNLFSDSNLSFTDDIDGQNRIVGGANWDIGADEFYIPKARIRGDVKFKGNVKVK